jgi:hypothetical protein
VVKIDRLAKFAQQAIGSRSVAGVLHPVVGQIAIDWLLIVF